MPKPCLSLSRKCACWVPCGAAHAHALKHTRASSEVEAAAAIFEVIFPGIEKIAHFAFNFILIVYLEYRAAPIFFVLIPITVGKQCWVR